jgi:hypothetical protein
LSLLLLSQPALVLLPSWPERSGLHRLPSPQRLVDR